MNDDTPIVESTDVGATTHYFIRVGSDPGIDIQVPPDYAGLVLICGIGQSERVREKVLNNLEKR